MIDFAALVLGPAMTIFGSPITIYPAASRPGVAPYTARGVFALKTVEIPLESGGSHSTVQPTLGVKLGDFTVVPDQGDFLTVNGTNYTIVDINPDGQGGADAMLREADLP